MALILDVSELTQTAAMKPTAHDNCIVLGLGTGPFPRDIEVRLPDDDGARQNALWDGSLSLAVNDKVLCFEYSGISAWRIMGVGGNDDGAGKVRVSEIWSNDFTSVSLATDASDNVTINTGTLTLPSDIIHLGDPDTKWSFTDDDVEITVGGLSMLKLTEAGQDLITLGPGSGDVDIDFNGDMFLQGSDGFFGIGIATPEQPLHIIGARSTVPQIRIGPSAAGYVGLYSTSNNIGGTISGASHDGTDFIARTTTPCFFTQVGTDGTVRVFSDTGKTIGVAFTPTERMRVASDGTAIGTTATSLAQLFVSQASTTAAKPPLLINQSDVSEEMLEFSTTIGVGNAIEAVGAKTLTVTHFIKITLPGGLTRYFEAGTIA